jgi:succinoglycan biosynthesis protein ExoA
VDEQRTRRASVTCRNVPFPPVSIILPVFDEIANIDGVIDSLVGQRYNGTLEIVIADGGSQDGTRDRLKERAGQDPRIVVLDNPKRRQPSGLNLAAAQASGEILVRADGHTLYDMDYVQNSVLALTETDAVAAGGPMTPVAEMGFAAAVVGAMNSALVLPARFHHAAHREEVDTVYLGAFRRSDFLAIGGFRTFPSGASEDADIYARWRAQGQTVIVDPGIKTEYTPRGSPGALWNQYFRYGMGKAEMLWANRRLPSLRPLAPMLLILGLVTFAVLAVATGVWWPLATLGGVWLAWLLFVGLRAHASTIGVTTAAAIMHASYGLGLVWGLVRGPWSVRRSLGS